MNTKNRVHAGFSQGFSEKSKEKPEDNEGVRTPQPLEHERMNVILGDRVGGRHKLVQTPQTPPTPSIGGKIVQGFRNGLKIRRRLANERWLNPPIYPFIILNPSQLVEADHRLHLEVTS